LNLEIEVIIILTTQDEPESCSFLTVKSIKLLL